MLPSCHLKFIVSVFHSDCFIYHLQSLRNLVGWSLFWKAGWFRHHFADLYRDRLGYWLSSWFVEVFLFEGVESEDEAVQCSRVIILQSDFGMMWVNKVNDGLSIPDKHAVRANVFLKIVVDHFRSVKVQRYADH